MFLSFILWRANGIRTRDPHTASVVRYQLRHSPSNEVQPCGLQLA